MYLTQEEVKKLLQKTDLTQTNHAIGIIVNEIKNVLSLKYNEKVNVEKGNIIVSLEDNYYALNYQQDEITLTSKYTKYLNENEILRTQMSSVIPSLLRTYKKNNLSEERIYLINPFIFMRKLSNL